MIHKNSNFRRFQRRKHINRKKHILKMWRSDNLPSKFDSKNIIIPFEEYKSDYGSCQPYWVYKYEGSLNKGKIHCSCKMCRFSGYTVQDRKNDERMLQGVLEYNGYDFGLKDKLEYEIRNSKFA